MAKETLSDQEIVTRFEAAKEVVHRLGSAYGRVQWDSELNFRPDYQYRTALAWWLAGFPHNLAASIPAGYFHDEGMVAINLTETRKLFRESKSVADPVAVTTAFLLAHEGVIHANTRKVDISGQNREEFIDLAIQSFNPRARREAAIIRSLNHPGTQVYLLGASIRYTHGASDRQGIRIGNTIDETIATALTLPIAALALSEIIYGPPSSPNSINAALIKGTELLWEFPLLMKNVSSDDFTLAFSFFTSHPETVRAYFAGEFIDQYVLVEEREPFLSRCVYLYFDQVGNFFRSLEQTG